MQPEIRYAHSQDLQIAYQVIGEGTLPLIMVNGWISNVEECWNLPGFSEWVAEITSFCKLIMFDKRGVGLSDRVDENQLPELDERVDDLRAIMDQEGIVSAHLLGFSEGGPMAILFAATYPQRTRSLILYGCYACWRALPDYPIGIPNALHQKSLEMITSDWGKPIGIHLLAPSMADDEVFRQAWATFMRKSASPKTATALYKMNLGIDVRHLLSDITVPTLVMHRRGDRLIPFVLGEYIANHIPNAQWLPLKGEDHLFWLGNASAITQAISEFLGAPVTAAPSETVIVTLLTISAFDQPLSANVVNDLQTSSVRDFQQTESTHVAIFPGPTAALKWATHQPQDYRMLIHTGACKQEAHQIGGAAVDLANKLLEQMPTPAIWLTKPARSLLSDFRYRFESVTSADMPLQVFAYQSFKENIQQPAHLLADSKLNEDDIRTLQAIQHYLDANFLQDDSLEDLSRRFGINLFKLKHGFKQLTGNSIKQYALGLKLAYAHQRILETDTPITTIALDLGYRQPGSFTRAFTKKYGISPHALRQTDADEDH